MRVLVLGSGAREHALAWRIGRSPEVEQVLCAPGSDGISRHAKSLPVDLQDHAAVVELARHAGADLVVVGPEDPLVAGIADSLRDAGFAVFGPSRGAAQLEGSKDFAKAFMARHGIPTAAHATFEDADRADRYIDDLGGRCVVKADGLAAGKGVFMCPDPGAARRAIAEIMRDGRFGASGARVVIEEWMDGEELSFYGICDGERFVCLPPAQDFKRALDDDQGENTGGMGAYSPVPIVGEAMERAIVEQVVRPVFDGIRAEGHPFRGVLFAGLMLDGDRVRVVEFNVRFGDPETESLMYRLESDLAPVLHAAAIGRLDPAAVALRAGDPSVCVALASGGYPRSYPVDVPIDGLEELESTPDVIAFHAGTRRSEGRWVTAGGRVVCLTARGPTIGAARDRAYAAADRVRFKGKQLRSDIARAAARAE
jgi:phosphoribosylamine--glycine ligase